MIPSIINRLYRRYEHLTKECEEKQEEFSKFEQEDIRCRESLKHAKAKRVKLEKSLEQEEKKVVCVCVCVRTGIDESLIVQFDMSHTLITPYVRE